VHLSMASTDRSIMGVSWVSLNQPQSVVQYGTSSTDLSQSAVGSITTYKAAGWIGNIHRATMTKLQEGTTYYYRVGDGANKWSEVFSFVTLTEGQELTFGIIGDMDYESNVTIANMIDLVEAGKVNCIIHPGDISYADGYEPHWDVFFRRIERIAARVPYMVAPGNHEFWYNFTSYKHRFFLPGVLDEGGSGDGMYYSFDAGLAHFVAGNSETAVDTARFAPAFLSWMEADIQAVDRSKTPFVIAFFHRPMYCSNDGCCTDRGGDTLKEQGEQSVFDNKVTMTISGHVHGYERSYPLYKGVPLQKDYKSPAGPVYVLQGGSGNREGNKGHYSVVPEWSAGNDQSVGFGLMKVSRESILFGYYAATPEGPVLKDEFEITK